MRRAAVRLLLVLALVALSRSARAEEIVLVLSADGVSPRPGFVEALRIQLAHLARAEVGGELSGPLAQKLEQVAEPLERARATLGVWTESVPGTDGRDEILLFIVTRQRDRVLVEVTRLPATRGPEVDRALALKVSDALDAVLGRGQTGDLARALEPGTSDAGRGRKKIKGPRAAGAPGVRPRRGAPRKASTARPAPSASNEAATQAGVGAEQSPVALEDSSGPHVSADSGPLRLSLGSWALAANAGAQVATPTGGADALQVGLALGAGARAPLSDVIVESLFQVHLVRASNVDDERGRVSAGETALSLVFRLIAPGRRWGFGGQLGGGLRILSVDGTTPDGREGSAQRGVPTAIAGPELRFALDPRWQLRGSLLAELTLKRESFALDGDMLLEVGPWRGLAELGVSATLP